MKCLRIMSYACALWTASTILLLAHSTEANGRFVLKEDAIKIANGEIDKLAIDYRDLDIEVDTGNRQWDEFMSILKESGVADSRERYKRYEAKLRGRTYWTIFYLPKRVEGRRPKGGGATVIIDARSGEVLIVIRGE